RCGPGGAVAQVAVTPAVGLIIGSRGTRHVAIQGDNGAEGVAARDGDRRLCAAGSPGARVGGWCATQTEKRLVAPAVGAPACHPTRTAVGRAQRVERVGPVHADRYGRESVAPVSESAPGTGAPARR